METCTGYPGLPAKVCPGLFILGQDCTLVARCVDDEGPKAESGDGILGKGQQPISPPAGGVL